MSAELTADDRVRGLIARGEIGGRTVQVDADGTVRCVRYPVASLPHGHVRVRSRITAISPGTETTFIGSGASNPYLHKTWDERLRVFRTGPATMAYPLFFGYRAMGEVTESMAAAVPVGTRIFGNWRHTESVAIPVQVAGHSRLPDAVSDEDAVDIAQMGPICLNAIAHAERAHEGRPVVVFGAGLVGIITAQAARASGASDVRVVDRLASRLAVAAALGFGTVNASAVEDVAVELKETLGPGAIAVAYECTGSAAALHEAIRVVRRRGLVVAVGFYQGVATDLALGEEFHHNAVDVRCSQIGNPHPDWDWARLRARTIELVLERELVLGALPREVLPVERAADAFALLARPSEVLQVALAY